MNGCSKKGKRSDARLPGTARDVSENLHVITLGRICTDATHSAVESFSFRSMQIPSAVSLLDLSPTHSIFCVVTSRLTMFAARRVSQLGKNCFCLSHNLLYH